MSRGCDPMAIWEIFKVRAREEKKDGMMATTATCSDPRLSWECLFLLLPSDTSSILFLFCHSQRTSIHRRSPNGGPLVVTARPISPPPFPSPSRRGLSNLPSFLCLVRTLERNRRAKLVIDPSYRGASYLWLQELWR